MTFYALTALVIIIAVVALIAYDVFAIIRGGYKATISFVLLTSARANPLIPFALGVLMGHLFWSQPTP